MSNVLHGLNSSGFPVPVRVDDAGRFITGGGGGGVAPPTGDNAVNTATVTSVASAASSTTILAANTARYGGSITNTDANALYLKIGGGTASATDYSVKLFTDDYFEIPFGFTGAITGIWAADGSGAALVTEYT